MNRFFELDSFIDRATEEMKKIIGPTYVSEKSRLYMLEYNERNREKIRRQNSAYSKTPEGKKSRKKTYAIRNRRIKHFRNVLSKEQKKLIQQFYLDCPSNYHVDHIFPVSKNGKHILWNLQYLTKPQNSRKNTSIPCPLETFEKAPFCPYPR